jgi:[Skp1-protein]-hydroxyproline N-acetylglucosaminyltransferase
MCSTGFTSEGLLRHGSAIEIHPMFGPKEPVLQPFWAAGFSFARGHFVLQVPYDCCTPMLFQGEEIDIAVRAWTLGYDL